jgi:hypothetical protein
MSCQVQLAHHIITHWIQTGDIRGVVTTHKGAVTANHHKGAVTAYHVVFGSEWGEKSKLLPTRQQEM